MPGTGRAEIYFIVGMFALTFILSGVAMYFFVKTYRKEMQDRERERIEKEKRRSEEETAASNESAVI